MAHEIENMIYVGETPWHGLGTRFINPPTIAESIQSAGLDWSVNLEPLYLNDKRQVEAQATLRSSDNSILGVVGPNYVPLQNKDAFEWFTPFLENNLATIETAGSLRQGKRVFILAKIKNDPMTIVQGDEVEKFVLLSNSHDGTMAVRAGFTPIRVVCQNTLSLAHSNEASKLLRVKHTSQTKTNLDAIRNVMNLANESFEATAETYRFLASKQISAADLEKYVKIVSGVPLAAIEDPESKAGNRIVEKVIPLFENGRGAQLPGVKGTYWAAYNAYNEYLGYQKGFDRDLRLDSLWFGQNAGLDVKALAIAKEMAMAA